MINDAVQATLDLPFLLVIAAFVTSAFTAVLGQGGGLMLMPLLVGFIPPQLLIPVHAIIQTSSNASRALLALPHIRWNIVAPIIFGIIIGGVVVTPFLNTFNWQWMQAIIALFILWMTWGKAIALKQKSKFALPTLGLMQGSLGMLLGATGPLGSALLLKYGLNKNQLVASNAVIMLASHVIKIVLFTFIGVQLSQYAYLIFVLCLAAIFGSYVGNHMRHKLPDKHFFIAFKVILTALALRMLVTAFG